MSKKAMRVAQAKFNKLAALNADQDAGGHIGMAARRTKARMADAWFNRTSGNVKGFYDAKVARAIKRGQA